MNFKSILAFIAPHKTIPETPWRAQHRWQLSPMRVLILFFGLSIFGLGDSLLIQAENGNAPWTVLAEGISKIFDIRIGVATFLISICVLLAWIPLREKLGFGTLANSVLIAGFIEIGKLIFPTVSYLPWQIGYDLLGIAMVGIGSALYITCGLGPGPRDGAMTGIHRVTGIRISRVRMGIELSVVLIGWLMGGTVGIGTLLFALLIGESIAISLGVVARLTSR